jgi:hypothetical protein
MHFDNEGDAASGETATVGWDVAPGTHGWYVTATDPHGATTVSEVRELVATTTGPGNGKGNGNGTSGPPWAGWDWTPGDGRPPWAGSPGGPNGR